MQLMPCGIEMAVAAPRNFTALRVEWDCMCEHTTPVEVHSCWRQLDTQTASKPAGP